jgi:hypothetical protein
MAKSFHEKADVSQVAIHSTSTKQIGVDSRKKWKAGRRRHAEDSLIFAFSAGKTLICHQNNADSVLRPQLGGLRTAVAADLRWTRKGRAADDSIYVSSKDFLSLRYH